MDYTIFVKGKTKIYHANLLKLYHERAYKATDITLQTDVAGMVVFDPVPDGDEECVLVNEDLLELRPRTDEETHEEDISKDLSAMLWERVRYR